MSAFRFDAMPPAMPPTLLSEADFRTVVRLAPLIAIDLIIRNPRSEVLLGLRNNEPAKGVYFVPGGIVLKNERLADAFARILKRETNFDARIEDARLRGAYEHFYEENRFGDPAFGTHYVVLGYELKMSDTATPEADLQHSELRFWTERELMASELVHDNTKAYFR
jgi:colanic acid biosynthesis protein WcaH